MKLILISYVELRKPKPIFYFDAAFKVCIYIYFQMCIAEFSKNWTNAFESVKCELLIS